MGPGPGDTPRYQGADLELKWVPEGRGKGGTRWRQGGEEGGTGVGRGYLFGLDFVTCSACYPSNQLKSYNFTCFKGFDAKRTDNLETNKKTPRHPPVGNNVPPG